MDVITAPAPPTPPMTDIEPITAACISSTELYLNNYVPATTNAFGEAFRVYDDDDDDDDGDEDAGGTEAAAAHERRRRRRSGVEETYRLNHINQTYEFATAMRSAYSKLDKTVMSIWECCDLLNEYVDESDPDVEEPQIQHLLQTAEAIRKDYPHPDHHWFHLTALIHDLGKVLLHPSFGEQPQWAVVGDTFPLGCPFDPAIVHSQHFAGNADHHNPKFNAKHGIYEEGCGLDNVTMSWGHDEYMYQVMKGNATSLPPQALFIIRYHSFYALHRCNRYEYLLDDFDRSMLPWLKRFNQYDLYSKSKVRVNVEEVKPYYLSLIEKYFPTKLRW